MPGYPVNVQGDILARLKNLARVTGGVPLRQLCREAFLEYLDKYEPLVSAEQINAERLRVERERAERRALPFTRPRRMALPKKVFDDE
jgi:hypothetical protein